VRLDKWLWAARFFKTRALAARSCELGRVASNGTPAKPSREVRVGDLLEVRSEAGEFAVSVLVISEVRGPAALALTYYQETEASQERRRVLAEKQKVLAEFEAPATGKLSKRDRRERERFRGRD
jgi:ribosome-associated heat shock protein Hsp15